MLRNLAAIGVLGFCKDDLRAKSGGVSDIKGSAISSGETRDIIFSTLEFLTLVFELSRAIF